jgi:hypothetical protein
MGARALQQFTRGWVQAGSGHRDAVQGKSLGQGVEGRLIP